MYENVPQPLIQNSFPPSLHPRMIVQGFDLAREEVLKFLDEFKVDMKGIDKEVRVLKFLDEFKVDMKGIDKEVRELKFCDFEGRCEYGMPKSFSR
jgi:hypothetical protein